MNLTETILHEYIELFHRTLAETSNQFLAPSQQDLLTHTALLPAKIVGYVSTQFGAAIEYFPSNRTDIQILRGSARIEDLLFAAPPSVRKLMPMFLVQEGDPGFYNTGGIFGGTFQGAFPFRLAGVHAGFRVGDAKFEAPGWNREVQFAEVFGNRSAEFWSRENAVSRAKDEVLAALSQTKRAYERKMNLTDYIAKFKERSVLLLGDYDEAGTQRLRRISAEIMALGYDPVVVSDVPDIAEQDLSQKVAMLGGLSRFVIVDDSTKSGHLTEVQICRTHSWITILLRDNGKGASWMTAGASATSNVLLELDYDASAPDDAVGRAVTWAEVKIRELGKTFDSIFPWRRQA